MEGALQAGERVAAEVWPSRNRGRGRWVRVGTDRCLFHHQNGAPCMAYEMKIRGTEDEVKVRSPWAAALLPIITLGIYHLVWWYRINRELRDYGKAKGYDLGQNPTNSVLALFPGGIIIVPAADHLLARHQARHGRLAPGRQGAAQRLDRDHPLPAARAGALGLHPGLAQRLWRRKPKRCRARSRRRLADLMPPAAAEQPHAPPPPEQPPPAHRLSETRRALHSPGMDRALLTADPRHRRRAVLPRLPGLGVGGAWGGLLRGDDQPAGGAARAAGGGGAALDPRAPGRGEVRRRHRQGALPHRRRPADRGGADALPRRAALGLRLLAVGLPADLHLLRHRPDEVRPQPQRRRDPRPGAPFPPHRSDRPRRLHGHGGADDEPRLRSSGACERLPDLGVTHRRTAISTVGWVPGIDRLAECEMPISLALSLHAPNDGLRSQLMPVNDRYPLAEVLAACERYRARRRRKVFVEYVMLDGVNDLPEHARELAALLDRRVYKVNLIPYNPTGAYDGSSPERIEALSRDPRRARSRRHRAAHPRPRHRRRLRPARRLRILLSQRGRGLSRVAGQTSTAATGQLASYCSGRCPPRPLPPSSNRRRCPTTRCGGWPTTSAPSGGGGASTRPVRATSASRAPTRSPTTRCRCCSRTTKSTARSSACACSTPGSSSCSGRRPTTSSPSPTRRTSTGASRASAT